MKANGLLVITVLIFIFLAWVATGGPSRPIASAGPSTAPITNVGETYRTTPPADGVRSDTSSVDRTNLYSYDRSTGGSVGRSSGSGGSVTIQHSSVGPSSTNPNQEYVVLSVSGGANVSISGWTLVSSHTGKRVTIGSGSEVVHSGSVNASAPILLRPGDIAYVTTGVSPMGASFRENECTGYLGQFQHYVPALAQSCPLPATEAGRYYRGGDTGTCSAALSALPRCTLASSLPGSSSLCVAFAQQYLTYNGCVSAHQSDSGFSLPIWRMYLGQSGELWGPSPETITLLDQNGATVDTYSY